MTWFENLVGFDEHSPQQVRDQLTVDGDCFIGANGRRIGFGRLQTPTLAELRQAAAKTNQVNGTTTVRGVIADVQHLHMDPANAGALFQVASQFNLLEMASPSVTPERGVGIYEGDRTQGPACAIACGGGTIYRNYFANVGDRIGQSASHQINCASDLGRLLGNDDGKHWQMQNGYLFPSDQGLHEISLTLDRADETQRDRYRASLRIGLQWNADVTLAEASHKVSQAYCSALPIAYGRQPTAQWREFATLVLEAAYEATFCAAKVNAQATGSGKLFLTLLGGGVFGNEDRWIIDAIDRAIGHHCDSGLDVAIVSYSAPKPALRRLFR
ncbi:hypothetical protein NHH03_15765 [Stieleria sp. TO1_6]|uniref:hypothetical protein n=1 Tax=Stieleria tagensis TaxID=2956795 RepID=UPI00209B303D|nr:hypothetical protein [Stieleria tagensis]MCO8123205.1 hypothetical protein [Stieleria tagensis]